MTRIRIVLACTLIGLGTTSLDGQAGVSALSQAVRTSENMEPAVPRSEQEKAVAKKLAALHAKTGKRPNILWLVVDDMGYGDPGVYGGGAAIGAATPNIDCLAREGLKLTATYSQPTCTPTRSAMMTGRLPARTGLTRPILAGDKVKKNPWEGERSVAAILSEAGYHTVLTGKWHTGEQEGMRPFDVGFDEFQGYYTSQKELTQQVDERRYPDLVLNPERLQQFQKASTKVDMHYGRKGKGEKVVEKTTRVEIVRIYNARQDPFESFDQYPRTLGQLPQHKSWMFNPVLARMSEHIQTLKDFPPTQRGSSLSIDQMVDRMISSHPSAN